MPDQRNDAPEEPDAVAAPNAEASADAVADAEPTEAVSVAPFIDDEDDEPTGAETDPAGAEDGDGDGHEEAAEGSDAGDAPVAEVERDEATGKAKKAKKGAKEPEPVERTVTRRQVTSKRVTPKGGAKPTPSGPKKSGAAASDEPQFSRRYTPPSQGAYAQGPSPAWVPVLMFALLILGAAIIISNYAGVFGSAANIRLVIGLALILGGIITATQYR